MSFWLIHPRDPVIFRDGRPFTADPGARATTLAFPFPSTLAGAVRTLSGTAANGKFDTSRIPELLQKEIRGPLLVQLDSTRVDKLFVPAPADALMLKVKEHPQQARRLWLRPVKLPDGGQTDFADLPWLVNARQPRKDKAHREKPAFWGWDDFAKWLRQPQDETLIPDINAFGLKSLPVDYRVHVRISSSTLTAEQGGLFVTSGLEFTNAPKDGNEHIMLQQAKEFGLLLETDADLNADTRWGFLGGERRIARWQETDQSFPACPDDLRESIMASKHCRLILLTPAIFKQGYLPEWVLHQAGVQAKVLAAAVPRYQTVSGWDYAYRNKKTGQRGRPKANRRLAPAGSVYYLKLNGKPENIHRFVDAIWMHNISDEPQDRRDGFGLAVLGAWDGEIVEMEVPNA